MANIVILCQMESVAPTRREGKKVASPAGVICCLRGMPFPYVVATLIKGG